MYTIYINNTQPPAVAVHEIYRDIFGPPMILPEDEVMLRNVVTNKVVFLSLCGRC